MKLTKVSVNGFKRFENETVMNLDGRIIAIVGPNEAGKSSFLKALQHFNHTDPFVDSGSSQELTRDAEIDTEQKIIEAVFLLEESDKQAIEHIPEAKNVRWVKFFRRKDGKSLMSQIPGYSRNLEPRKKFIKNLESFLNRKIIENLNSEEHPEINQIREIIPKINLGEQTLESPILEEFEEAFKGIENLIQESDSKYIKNLPQELAELLEHEKKERPSQLAAQILFDRVPEFLFFDDDSRSLQSEYTLEGEIKEYPSSLQNLMRIARLNIEQLINAINSGDYGKVETLITEANHQLVENLSKIWSQTGITVRLQVDGKELRILVKDNKTNYVPIAERSEGLRQFVALVSFVSIEASEVPPILLIDEAEMHLHYDAQADFVQMLTRQNLSSKIIYTTHSIGCLPEDLGMGIRLIEPLDDGTSVINNWFWNSNRQGFSPLLFGMGARTLAFIPIRNAVITEGASDIILLPAILREVIAKDFLGFQIVPGLASASEEEIAMLKNESSKTLFLTDSDGGGSKIKVKLIRAGIPNEHIFKLPDKLNQGLVIEDYIDADIYLQAVNQELIRSYGNKFSIKKNQLPNINRPKKIEELCKQKRLEPPNKRAVAYHIIENKTSNPDSLIVSNKYRESLNKLYINIVKTFSASKKL